MPKRNIVKVCNTSLGRFFWQRQTKYLFDKKVIAFSNENAIWSMKLHNAFPRQGWTAYLPTELIYPWQIMVFL